VDQFMEIKCVLAIVESKIFSEKQKNQFTSWQPVDQSTDLETVYWLNR
jgi:hypothetical protein